MTRSSRLQEERSAGPASASWESDGRLAKRSRIASLVLVFVVVVVSVFALWASQATDRAANQAVAASGLSDDYADAASAVSTEESLERKYRLEPGLGVRDRFDDSAASLVTAMTAVRRDGGTGDRTLAARVLSQHAGYLTAIVRLFAAVDRGDAPAALQIDRTEVDPVFGSIETSVRRASSAKHEVALERLARLQRIEAVRKKLIPLLLVVGLLLALAVASITRGHRRLLVVERRRALDVSLHDSLTGLPNRTLFADRFGQALRADGRAGTATGLLLIDLDRFKEINDTFGHHYGDELLTQIGPRLSAVLREVDTVARLGGDEFAVLLPEVGSVQAAVTVAKKLRASLDASFHVEGVDLDVEASIGVVLSGEHGNDVNTLLQRVDVAMYVAKSQDLGVSAYDPAVDGHSPAKLTLLGDLRRAIEAGDLVLHYQPKINIRTRDVVGAEALVRWQHAERGLVFPDEFIPLAEHTGLIGSLTRYVLDAALAQARHWSDAGQPLSVSVNVSARSLLDESLPDQVAELLSRHGVPAAALELEVTESAIMTEPARAQHLLQRLSDLGVRLSIDDFGVGYTSLAQLKNLPVSELKIDRSFVMTMSEDHSNAVIVQSVVDLGHNLGLTIVAEGVETEQALATLAGFECDVAQGYHFSRPMTPHAFDTWFAERRSRTRVQATISANPQPVPKSIMQ
jgi:diguanylate cyclase